MVDRYRVWLGAGFLAGGMSAAMLTGAGVAAADDGASAGSESQTASGAKDSGDSDGGSSVRGAATSSSPSGSSGKHRKADDDEDDADAEAVSDDESGSVVGADDAAEDDIGKDELDDTPADIPDDAPDEDGDLDADGRDEREPVDPADLTAEVDEPDADEVQVSPPVDESVTPDPEAGAPPAEAPAQTPADGAIAEEVAEPSSFVTDVETDLGDAEAAVVMRLAAADAPQMRPTAPSLVDVLDNVGTAIYNFYTGAMQFLAGPVRAPFGSKVRVESSTLQLGGGVEVPGDWYFPDTDEPAGIIYLQHGFMATAAFYSATAAYLAEKTLSIVVAPTLTWNIFDHDNYPLMLSRTHRAIADLFTGDRAALNASAQAAGYTATLPSRVVLAGHSAGGGLAVGAARHLSDLGATANLAGVVMLDGVGYLDHLSSDLAEIPHHIPVYNLAGQPYGWNSFGDASVDLAEARPGEFTGVIVNGGLHADAMQSSNPVIQFATYLATGFSKPWNVAAGEMLSSGWINDMLYGTYTAKLYGRPGATLNIFTGWWVPSAAQVLPAQQQDLTPVELLFACLLNPATTNCTYVTPADTRPGRRVAGRVA